MNVTVVCEAFPEITDLREVDSPSGQKHVFFAKRGAEPVVLKLIRRYRGAEERTEREIRAVSILRSSFVPRIFDQGSRVVQGENTRFILEQFVQGTTLRAKMDSIGALPVPFVIHLLDSLLRACCDFENAALVHRDIKPENLMVDPDDKIWVIDFGIARHLDLSSLTISAGFGLGTCGYAAPEQFRNIKTAIDSRADLFSVGVIAYECLSAAHPFFFGAANALEVFRRMEREDFPPLPVLGGDDGRLADFVMQLVQRYPSRRPQSAIEAFHLFADAFAKDH